MCLDIDFVGRQKKTFFINDQISFKTLKDMIDLEYPGIQVEIDFSHTN